ncbi:LysR family transcriptional regulator [Vibrio sp. JC009]|uniref:LysR family transcriptional regulator n=1 Tax=Vibrio sp. JC009 TaxID=2912314 RepID=UPI0023B08D26|nr:LysR family transcriptional regulator [Vibrio sp. JC009]WED22185.1 LysR family transcriptional regulator [Vibrio sp. JC009]
MLSNVNLNLLRSLHVLLEECHVSNAAQRLHVSQSAVSRQLSQLRELFGDPLLIREGNRLIPTPKALDIKVKLSALFKEFDHLLDEQNFEPSQWSGEVVFASSDYVAQYIFPDFVVQTRKQAPNATFRYVMWQPEYLSELSNTNIHLASTMLPEKPDGLSSLFLGEDKPVIVMSQGHALSQQPELSVDDILRYPHIVVSAGGDKNSQFEAALRKIKRTRTIGLRVPFFSAAFHSLLNSDYLLVIPEHIARTVSQTLPVIYRTIPLDLASHKYWLIWHTKYDQDPAHSWVREQASEVLKSSIYSIGYNLKS